MNKLIRFCVRQELKWWVEHINAQIAMTNELMPACDLQFGTLSALKQIKRELNQRMEELK